MGEELPSPTAVPSPSGVDLPDDLIQAMGQGSILGEMETLSEEIDDNADEDEEDNRQTLVNDPMRSDPEPADAASTEATAPSEPRDETRPPRAQFPLRATTTPAPEPALPAAPSEEAEGAESTVVDHEAPVVLVDRPFRESRAEELDSDPGDTTGPKLRVRDGD